MAQYPTAFVQEVATAALRRVSTKNWEMTLGDGSQFVEPDAPDGETHDSGLYYGS
jgi:hypothetical protein